MNLSLPKWITKNRGKAASSFKQAIAPVSKTVPHQTARVSSMVKKSQLGLQNGPRPPAPLYAAGTRMAFNANWREEYRKSFMLQNAPLNPSKQFQQANQQQMGR